MYSNACLISTSPLMMKNVLSLSLGQIKNSDENAKYHPCIQSTNKKPKLTSGMKGGISKYLLAALAPSLHWTPKHWIMSPIQLNRASVLRTA